MAEKANVFRKAAAELLTQELSAMRITAGILIKAYRGYKRPNKPHGYTQDEIAVSTIPQPQVSLLENGKAIPKTPKLKQILKKCGFDTASEPGREFLQLLEFLRDAQPKVKGLVKDKPR